MKIDESGGKRSRAIRQELKDIVLDPYDPTRNRATAKVRCRHDGVEEAALKVQKSIKVPGRTDTPAWAAMERSREQGRHRRTFRNIVDNARQAYPMLDINSKATIYTGGLEAEMNKVYKSRWGRRPAWQGTGANWERLEVDIQK